MKIRKWDIPLLAILAALSLLPLAFFGNGGAEEIVTVAYRGETIYSGPLSVDRSLTTPDGKNEIVISSGRAYMARADCPDGLCLAAGEAKVHKPIVCLPNRVTVTIVREGAETDAVVY